MEPRERENIHALQEKLDDVGKILTSSRSLAALYINCSKINRIEGLFGKKIYLDIVKKIHDVIMDMRGKFIRRDDIIVSLASGSEEFAVFLSQKRTQQTFGPSDLDTLCGRINDYLNETVFPITFTYLRGGPKIMVGYAVVLYNPLMREERLINKLIDDAKLMSTYHEFKRVMRYKEKLQEIILKESIRTLFQPIVDFSEKKILGYEALSRGPEGTEFENPYILFDAAGESDLLFELDRLCRKKALENAIGLAPDCKLFVNCLPSMVLDPEFKDEYLKSLLEQLKMNAVDIVFEITEREAIENYNLFNEAIKYYTDLGFAIAVDDTGAGFSSLETVVELKPQYIKLDISLVRGIERNILKQELIKAILGLSRQMNSMVIAEGIETIDELNALKKIGITVGQGFLFTRPGPAFPKVVFPPS